MIIFKVPNLLLLVTLFFMPSSLFPNNLPSSNNFLGIVLNEDDDSLNFKLLNQKKRQLGLVIDELEDKVREHQKALDDFISKNDLTYKIQRYENEKKDLEDRILSLKNKEKKLQKVLEDKREKAKKPRTEDEKNKLLIEINQLQSEVSENNERIDRYERVLKYDLKSKLEEYKSKLSEYDNHIAATNKIKELLKDKQNELFEVDNSLSELLNRDSLKNRFRLHISIAFTILVGVVIVGFYWIALRKEGVATNIFVGEKGIQFITLFLIIISIILFGIMGTLESKELSALLGALSGYILGRSSQTNDNKTPPSTNPNVPKEQKIIKDEKEI